MKYALIFLSYFLLPTPGSSQAKTYCNPINIDYGYTPIPNFTNWGKHRATADPVIVNYKGDFYLFSTNQWGYWWSSDMSDWKFVPKKFLRPWNEGYDELCAPAVGIVGDTMLVFGSTYTNKFTLWMSTDPKANAWKPLVDSFEIGGWDPSFFTDDDGKFYMYNGSSNVFPLYGIELDRKTFKPKGTRKEVHFLKPWRYGWQRFGEHMDNTFLDPFMEGAHVTKYKGKYYLQYGAPGTEFSGYADGVTVSDKPLDGFVEQSDPLSMKLGGYARGAGHGATFQDNRGAYWHTSTIMISVKNNFERRVGIWPSGFDNDGVMWCNTAFGDYPHKLPSQKDLNTSINIDYKYHPYFTGWMLLNYNKPVQVSSTFGGHHTNAAVDENIKTHWSAATGDSGEWIQSDLGASMNVYAIQINYADQDATFVGKTEGKYHRYILYSSVDGKKWEIAKDKSKNLTDVPHDYIEFEKPINARYFKLENIAMPSGKFALSGFRIFGMGNGEKPSKVKDFMVLRTEKDKRSAWIKWSPVENAYAYNIYYGTHGDKLYNCVMVHDANEYWFKSMDALKKYYFTIEAINENGIGTPFEVIEVE
jgi:xylan 1,4-beta-xylosidase